MDFNKCVKEILVLKGKLYIDKDIGFYILFTNTSELIVLCVRPLIKYNLFPRVLASTINNFIMEFHSDNGSARILSSITLISP